MREFDATGIDMDQKFEPAPAGEYWLQITDVSETDKNGNERVTKNGDPYVRVECEIVDDAEWAGKKVWNNVIFLYPGEDGKVRRGAWIALVFLKAIGQPHEGRFKPDPNLWVGKRFRAKLKITKDSQGNGRNEIAFVVLDVAPVDSEMPF